MSHSLLGGSSAKRYLNCPASVNLYQLVKPEDDETEAAAVGTTAHSVAEHLLENILKKDKFSSSNLVYRGPAVINTQKYKIEVTDAIKRDAKNYVNSLHKTCVQLGIEWSKNNISIEAPVKYGELNTAFNLPEDLEIRGSIDFLAIDPVTKRILIADLKYGVNEVPISNNHQVMLYMLCVIDTYIGSVYEAMADGWTFYGMIYQPRKVKGTASSLIQLDGLELDAFASLLRKTVTLIVTKKGEYKVGDHCTFCAVKPHCNTYADSMRDSVVSELGSFDKSIPIHIGKLVPPAELTCDQLSTLAYTIKALSEYEKSVRKEIEKRIKDGSTVKGFSLETGLSNRSWADPQVVMNYLYTHFKSEYDNFFTERELLSPAQLEKLDKDRFLPVVELLSQRTKTSAKLKETQAIEDLSLEAPEFFNRLTLDDLEEYKKSIGLS